VAGELAEDGGVGEVGAEGVAQHVPGATVVGQVSGRGLRRSEVSALVLGDIDERRGCATRSRVRPRGGDRPLRQARAAPRGPARRRRARSDHRLEGWAPDEDDGMAADLALLRLADPCPGLQPLPLRSLRSLDGSDFAVYGFPDGYDTSVYAPTRGRSPSPPNPGRSSIPLLQRALQPVPGSGQAALRPVDDVEIDPLNAEAPTLPRSPSAR